VIPLVAPTITDYDIGWVQDAVSDGALENDDEVRSFEEEFAEYVGCAGGVAVNSGTNALIVALRAWSDKTIDTAAPSFSCRALLDAAAAVNSEPFLYDNHCDVPAAQFSLKAYEVTEGDVVIAPHMFGTNGQFGLVEGLIEDLTLSLGAVQSPHIGVCSFNRDKMISTGRGGMIVSQDEEFLAKCRRLAYYDSVRVGVLGSERYMPAFSFGMTAMQAALGRSQLRQLPGFIERRREIATRYTAAFREVGIETPDPDVESVFFRYIIGVNDPGGKVEALRRRGVEVGRGVNPPLHRLLGLPNDQFPGAEECFSKLLSVPCHPSLTDEQVQYVMVQVLEVCAP
jgi:perosamine synthetase